MKLIWISTTSSSMEGLITFCGVFKVRTWLGLWLIQMVWFELMSLKTKWGAFPWGTQVEGEGRILPSEISVNKVPVPWQLWQQRLTHSKEEAIKVGTLWWRQILPAAAAQHQDHNCLTSDPESEQGPTSASHPPPKSGSIYAFPKRKPSS